MIRSPSKLSFLRPGYFLVPAVFLLLLGSGNILVGTFKARQYQQVYAELIVTEPVEKSPLSSSLARIQAVSKSPDRLRQRQREASDRNKMYELVVFGGKLFVTFGLLLLCVGSTLRYAEVLRKQA